jgi:RHS repeat-associated protein
VAERIIYSPYGQPTFLKADWTPSNGPDGQNGTADDGTASDFHNAILYCGYRFDSESGLYHVRHRYLHPTLGRWITQDPAGYVDGLSLYEYCRSGPVAAFDSFGLWKLTGFGVMKEYDWFVMAHLAGNVQYTRKNPWVATYSKSHTLSRIDSATGSRKLYIAARLKSTTGFGSGPASLTLEGEAGTETESVDSHSDVEEASEKWEGQETYVYTYYQLSAPVEYHKWYMSEATLWFKAETDEEAKNVPRGVMAAVNTHLRKEGISEDVAVAHDAGYQKDGDTGNGRSKKQIARTVDGILVKEVVAKNWGVGKSRNPAMPKWRKGKARIKIRAYRKGCVVAVSVNYPTHVGKLKGTRKKEYVWNRFRVKYGDGEAGISSKEEGMTRREAKRAIGEHLKMLMWQEAQ